MLRVLWLGDTPEAAEEPAAITGNQLVVPAADEGTAGAKDASDGEDEQGAGGADADADEASESCVITPEMGAFLDVVSLTPHGGDTQAPRGLVVSATNRIEGAWPPFT